MLLLFALFILVRLGIQTAWIHRGVVEKRKKNDKV